jgi:DUF1365 family protein
MNGSALYIGSVNHRRFRPVAHHLRYRMFWLLLDLDGVPDLDRSFRCFAHNRFGIFSFHDRDHGAGDGTPPAAWARAELAAHGLPADGPIQLLAMPRILGYGFNPLSVYFCHGADGGLAAIIYEVHNTFGERHSYIVAAGKAAEGSAQRHAGDKQFYVSPFMDMGMRYAFRTEPPDRRLTVAIKGSDADGPLITAALSAERHALTDAALAKVFATHPLLTLKVIVAIHWHALRLWWKGVALRPRPGPPAAGVTELEPLGRS